MVAPLRILSLAELADLHLPETRWLVEGLIPAGVLALLVGRPKAGKSLLAVDLLVSIALGELYLGRAVTQGPVLYAPAEDSLDLVRTRLWTRLGQERNAPVSVMPVDGSLEQTLWLDKPETIAQLLTTIQETKPVLLVLDPLRELHHAKENDADEMSALLRPVRQIAHQTSTTILIVHHRNKVSTDPGTAARGSSAITGSVDMVMTLDTQSDDDLTVGQGVTLTVEGRYAARTRLAARLGKDLRWDPADGSTFVVDATLPARIVRTVQASPTPMTAEQIGSALNLSAKTVQNTMRGLVKDGRLTRVGKGTNHAPFAYLAGSGVPSDGSHVPEGIGVREHGNHLMSTSEHGSRVLPDREPFGNGAGAHCVDCGAPATHRGGDDRDRCQDHAMLAPGGLSKPLYRQEAKV